MQQFNFLLPYAFGALLLLFGYGFWEQIQHIRLQLKGERLLAGLIAHEPALEELRARLSREPLPDEATWPERQTVFAVREFLMPRLDEIPAPQARHVRGALLQPTVAGRERYALKLLDKALRARTLTTPEAQ